jgi:hypothetical protein
VAIVDILNEFKANVAQCNALIANAHRLDGNGAFIFSPLDRQQITVAAFLNLFIAWETFLENSIAEIMTGGATISGTAPIKYVAPLDADAARKLVIGVMRHFDHANHDNVRRIVGLYFQNGYPFEVHLNSIFSELSDLRTMRNASAHISSTTQTALEALAARIFGQPNAGVSLYQLLTAVDPRAQNNDTVFVSYKNKLVVAAELIAQG